MAEDLDELVLLSKALGALANVLNGRSLLREHVQVARRRHEISQDERFEDIREKIDTPRGVGVALMYVGETCFFVALSAGVHALRGDNDQASNYAEESYDYMVSMSGLPEEWQRNQFY